MARNRETRPNVEIRLMEALQQNCDRPNKDLAFDLEIDASTLSRIKDRLEKEGYIKNYKAVLNPSFFQLGTLAFIRIALSEADRKHVDATVQFLGSCPEVQELHSIEGEYDMLIKIRVGSNADVLDFTLNKLTLANNIKDTSTMIMLATHKETTDIQIRREPSA